MSILAGRIIFSVKDHKVCLNKIQKMISRPAQNRKRNKKDFLEFSMFSKKFQLSSSKKNQSKPHQLLQRKMNKFMNQRKQKSHTKLKMNKFIQTTSLWITKKIISIITKNKILSMSTLMNNKLTRKLKLTTFCILK